MSRGKARGWASLLGAPDEPLMAWQQMDGWQPYPDGHSLLGTIIGLGPELIVVDDRLPDLAPETLFERVRSSHPGCYRVVVDSQGPGVAEQTPGAPVQRRLAGPWSWRVLHQALAEAQLQQPLRRHLAELDAELDHRLAEQELQRARHIAAWRFLARGLRGVAEAATDPAPARLASLQDLCDAVFRFQDVDRAAPVRPSGAVDLGDLLDRLITDTALPVPVTRQGRAPKNLSTDPALFEVLLLDLLAGVAALPGCEAVTVRCRRGRLELVPLPPPAVTQLAGSLEPFYLDPVRTDPASPAAMLLPTAAMQARRLGLELEARRTLRMDGVVALVWPDGTWPKGGSPGL